MRTMHAANRRKNSFVLASLLLLGLAACSIDQAETNKHASGPFTAPASAPLESTGTIQ